MTPLPIRPNGWGFRRPARQAASAFFLVLLAACGQDEKEPAPASVSAGEQRALDEAAEMLEEQRHAAKDAKAAGEQASPAPSPASE